MSHSPYFWLPGNIRRREQLRSVVANRLATASGPPRWIMPTSSAASAAYGNFFFGSLQLEGSAWGLSSAEFRVVSPQQLIVLEACYAAFARNGACGGNCRQRLVASHVGVYLGIAGCLVDANLGDSGTAKEPRNGVSVYAGTANSLAVASGRVSYTLGLTGPCFPVDTACSASLVALHLATGALHHAECLAACICGEGLLEPTTYVAFSAAGMLSALGRCHTFDRRADGYGRGEGCGAFYFSTSGDVAVSGTAVQQDGPSASLTAPNGSSQRRLIEAVRGGGIDPVLEAHGTGTALGDPIEASAFHRAFVMRARTIRQYRWAPRAGRCAGRRGASRTKRWCAARPSSRTWATSRRPPRPRAWRRWSRGLCWWASSPSTRSCVGPFARPKKRSSRDAMYRSQAERAFGVDRVVGVVPHARRGAAAVRRRDCRGAAELVRVQRDHRARALCVVDGRAVVDRERRLVVPVSVEGSIHG